MTNLIIKFRLVVPYFDILIEIFKLMFCKIIPFLNSKFDGHLLWFGFVV